MSVQEERGRFELMTFVSLNVVPWCDVNSSYQFLFFQNLASFFFVKFFCCCLCSCPSSMFLIEFIIFIRKLNTY